MRKGAETLSPTSTTPVNTVREFDKKYKYVSSLEAMRQDPLYQWLISQGDKGVSRLLMYLTSTRSKPTWLMMALDEITGQDVTGLRNPDTLAKGITLPVMHRNVIRWAEQESRISIHSEAEVSMIGADAMKGLRGMFMPIPVISQAVTEALFSQTGQSPITSRSITADLLLDGQPTTLNYSHTVKKETYGSYTKEKLTLVEPTNPENPTLYVSTSYNGIGSFPYYAQFSTNTSRLNTRDAQRQIAAFISAPHTIEGLSATAKLA